MVDEATGAVELGMLPRRRRSEFRIPSVIRQPLKKEIPVTDRRTCCGLLLVALACAGIPGCDEQPDAAAPVPDSTLTANPAMMPTASAPANPLLTTGTIFPELNCAGWLNGDAPAFDGTGSPLTVIDIWGSWCVGVQDCAATLTEIHDQYAPRGVAFVSVTNHPQRTVESFVETHRMTWPHGYGATVDQLNAWGAWNNAMAMTAGYEAWPTVYLVNASGEILWTDDRQRTTHEEPERFRDRLTAALDQHLSEGADAGDRAGDTEAAAPPQ